MMRLGLSVVCVLLLGLPSPARANFWANKGDWERSTRQDQNGYVMGAIDGFTFLDSSGSNFQYRVDLISCLQSMNIDSHALIGIVNREYDDLSNWQYPPSVALIQGLGKICLDHINTNRAQRSEAPLQSAR